MSPLPNALLARLDDRVEDVRQAAETPLEVPKLFGRADRDAAEEFARCRPLRQADLDWFRSGSVSSFTLLGYRQDPAAMGVAAYELGLPKHWPIEARWVQAFDVRRAPVQFLPRQRFVFGWDRRADPDEVGAGYVMPALDEHESLGDLVAWQPKTGRMASLYGLPGLDGVIGEYRPFCGEPLVVFIDPLAWLGAGRRGVVIVHEAAARRFLLAQETIQAADLAHGEAVEAMLRKVRLPKIVVPAAAERRVAA